MTKRRAKFRRSKNAPIRITADDITVLRLLRTHRFRRTEDIHRHVPHRSLKKLRERLRLLYDHGHIDRPLAQRDNHLRTTKAQIIYALGNHGAQLLSELDGVEAPKSNWTQKNRSVKRPHIQHTLRIADVTDAVHRLPHNVQDASIISADAILQNAPLSTQRDQKPWQWHARVRTKDGSLRSAIAVPDFIFGIDLITARKRFYYFVECDRGTMPVQRSNDKQTSVARKFDAYLAGFHAALHRSRYGIGNIRFLICTTSAARIETMRTVLYETAGATDTSMFLFTENKHILTASHILSVPWIDSAGNSAALID